jgi:hypothetical protein
VTFRCRGRQGSAAPQTISLSKDYSFDQDVQLAKEHEADILRQQMARDLVAIAMRRLTSLKYGARPRAAGQRHRSNRLQLLLDQIWIGACWWRRREVIPGSYWGEREAGLIGSKIYARLDTPLHSVLHEERAFHLHDAGAARRIGHRCGRRSRRRECRVLPADPAGESLPNVGRERMCRDMDEWGYSFRLGSAAAWFAEDAEDARQWLIRSTASSTRAGADPCLPLAEAACRAARRLPG